MMPVFVLTLVLLMSNGDVVTSSKVFPDNDSCMASGIEAMKAARNTMDVNDAEGLCIPVELKPNARGKRS